MNRRKVITVDGLLATGKTSLAKALAEKLGYVYLSTGMLYRGIAYLLIREHKFDLLKQDQSQLTKFIDNFTLELKINPKGEQILLINDENVTSELFSSEVSLGSSKVAESAAVRTLLYPLQRNAFPDSNIVAEGRDMGSVVFKDADFKFFIEIDLEVKIERRYQQVYKDKNLSQDQANSLKLQLKQEIEERDRRDQERAIAPTIVPDGAVIINNSHKTLTQVVQNMYDLLASAGLI
jgi:cytidylate kinase